MHVQAYIALSTVTSQQNWTLLQYMDFVISHVISNTVDIYWYLAICGTIRAPTPYEKCMAWVGGEACSFHSLMIREFPPKATTNTYTENYKRHLLLSLFGDSSGHVGPHYSLCKSIRSEFFLNILNNMHATTILLPFNYLQVNMTERRLRFYDLNRWRGR